MNQIDTAVFDALGEPITYINLQGNSITIQAIERNQVKKIRRNGNLIIERHVIYQFQKKDIGTYPERGGIIISTSGIKYKIEAIINIDIYIFTVLVLKLKSLFDFFIDETGAYMVDELGDYMTD